MHTVKSKKWTIDRIAVKKQGRKTATGKMPNDIDMHMRHNGLNRSREAAY